MKALHLFAAGAALALSLAAGTASATPTLTLTDPGTLASVIVQDNGLNDWNPALDAVTYVGPIGSRWNINVTTGISPVPGAGIPRLDLNSVDTTVQGGGTLLISLSDLVLGSWTGPGAQAVAGGTFMGGGNSALFQTFVDNVLVSSLSFNSAQGLAFSGSDFFEYVSDGEALVTMYATLFHPDASLTSFDYSLVPVPEPGTMMLLGSAFLCLAIYGKRRGYRRI